MPTIEFLTVEEAALVLGRDRTIIYYWIKQGKLIRYKRYGKTLVRPEEVEALKKELETKAENES